MVEVGDRIEVTARKVGQEPRRGRVTGMRGSLVEVRWENGEQTAFVPAAGSLTVIARTRRAEDADEGTGSAAVRRDSGRSRRTVVARRNRVRANGRSYAWGSRDRPEIAKFSNDGAVMSPSTSHSATRLVAHAATM